MLYQAKQVQKQKDYERLFTDTKKPQPKYDRKAIKREVRQWLYCTTK